ncbi:MAG: FAD-dependent 5-carboxymethylaminomethyl-2-thiouridine(34) oxidoreductase MnmC [Caldimonas sp.]
MKSTPIRAAAIARDNDGLPRSATYGDVYHPRGGALAQARHVFLDGDALAARWRGRERFVVLETGFGLGNNFLATWAAWRADPARCRQLHFLSIEGSPPSRTDLAAIERDPELAVLASTLVERWPPLTFGMHRIAFDNGAVELLLAFGDVAAWLPQLGARVDAFFLDGFAPARNPAMWDARLYKAMARLAAPGATVATWTAARAVREGLAAAGFEVTGAAGAGGKRDITRARFAPRFAPRTSPRLAAQVAARSEGDVADVIVVGAGLAGCALAAALAAHGRSTLLLEREPTIAAQASGNAGGIFHGVVHRGDGTHARWHRAAALAAADAVRAAVRHRGVRGSVSGVLRIAPETADRSGLQALIDVLALPDDYVRALDAEAARALAGVQLAGPAWHFPGAGWVDPRGLAQAWLDDAGGAAKLRTGIIAAALSRSGGRWTIRDRGGATIASAQTVVLCNAGGALDLLGRPPWPIAPQRGQASSIAESRLPPDARPRLPITGAGYVVPASEGAVWFGASAHWDDGDPQVRASDQEANVERLRRLVGLTAAVDIAELGGRSAVRWQSSDRLPVIGAVPLDVAGPLGGVETIGRSDATSAARRLDQARFVARAPGLFVCIALGSRGIASSALGARIVAAMVAGAPLPVEADLLDAIDPARFLVRRFRRGESARRGATSSFDQPPVGPDAGFDDA